MPDVAIVGSGPAALAAALYLGRAGLKVQVYEKNVFGGELNQIAEISNYPGFSGSGQELANNMLQQAKAVGAKFDYGECQAVVQKSDHLELKIDGEWISSRVALIATGTKPKQLSFKPEPSVSYCALCDGVLAKGKNVAVIGGANAAVQEALYLAPLVHRLTLITHSQLKADAILQTKLRATKNVKIIENLEPTEELLSQYDYIFVCIGKLPNTDFLGRAVHRDVTKKAFNLPGSTQLKIKLDVESTILNRAGYIITGEAKHLAHQSAIPRLFAAGDVRTDCPKQVVTAAGDGAAAAIEIAHFLRETE